MSFPKMFSARLLLFVIYERWSKKIAKALKSKFCDDISTLLFLNWDKQQQFCIGFVLKVLLFLEKRAGSFYWSETWEHQLLNSVKGKRGENFHPYANYTCSINLYCSLHTSAKVKTHRPIIFFQLFLLLFFDLNRTQYISFWLNYFWNSRFKNEGKPFQKNSLKHFFLSTFKECFYLFYPVLCKI